jgi:hypothetical protein
MHYAVIFRVQCIYIVVYCTVHCTLDSKHSEGAQLHSENLANVPNNICECEVICLKGTTYSGMRYRGSDLLACIKSIKAKEKTFE